MNHRSIDQILRRRNFFAILIGVFLIPGILVPGCLAELVNLTAHSCLFMGLAIILFMQITKVFPAKADLLIYEGVPRLRTVMKIEFCVPFM
mmetsp:Transcript_20920/g.27040  ORF Transcript_20920/g.27040 Transcript_20920/m.27040 type:complete len:91 (-) Transcript_20920:15-287(-)